MKNAPTHMFCALRRNFRGATQLCFPITEARSAAYVVIRAAGITGAVARRCLLALAFGAPSGAHSPPPSAPPSHYRRLPLPCNRKLLFSLAGLCIHDTIWSNICQERNCSLIVFPGGPSASAPTIRRWWPVRSSLEWFFSFRCSYLNPFMSAFS